MSTEDVKEEFRRVVNLWIDELDEIDSWTWEDKSPQRGWRGPGFFAGPEPTITELTVVGVTLPKPPPKPVERTFRAMVTDAGGGHVDLVIDSATKDYPPPGEWVTVAYTDDPS